MSGSSRTKLNYHCGEVTEEGLGLGDLASPPDSTAKLQSSAVLLASKLRIWVPNASSSMPQAHTKQVASWFLAARRTAEACKGHRHPEAVMPPSRGLTSIASQLEIAVRIMIRPRGPRRMGNWWRLFETHAQTVHQTCEGSR
ncbi:hypothetical protein HDV63DRAFT_233493 [Trichoderma sp. SZMC 28014]